MNIELTPEQGNKLAALLRRDLDELGDAAASTGDESQLGQRDERRQVLTEMLDVVETALQGRVADPSSPEE